MLEAQEKYKEEKTRYSKSNSDKEYSYVNTEDNEVDLVDLGKELWERRKVILISGLVAFFIGILVALMTPEEYTAEIVMMPQTSSSASDGINSGLLKQFGLGGIAGGMGSVGNSGSISANLYPNITQSTPFCLQMMDQSFHFVTLDTTVSLSNYFVNLQGTSFIDHVKTYTLGLPKLLIKIPASIINIFKNDNVQLETLVQENTSILSLTVQDSSLSGLESTLYMYKPITITSQQQKVIKELQDRITTSVEPNGTVMVSVKMPDPQVAAGVTEAAAIFLTTYIKDYRVNKALEDLRFIEEQYKDKEARYNLTQQKLANIRDRNANIVTERAKIELERAQTDFDLASNLFQSVAQQLEQARIKVQEETPLFKVLEPVQVPLSKSEPNVELIIIMYLFGGFFIGFSIVISRILYLQLKHNFK